MKKEVSISQYEGKIKIVDEKKQVTILEIEKGDYGFLDLMDAMKEDPLFEHYDGSGLYQLEEVKFLRRKENHVTVQFHFNAVD